MVSFSYLNASLLECC